MLIPANATASRQANRAVPCLKGEAVAGAGRGRAAGGRRLFWGFGLRRHRPAASGQKIGSAATVWSKQTGRRCLRVLGYARINEARGKEIFDGNSLRAAQKKIALSSSGLTRKEQLGPRRSCSLQPPLPPTTLLPRWRSSWGATRTPSCRIRALKSGGCNWWRVNPPAAGPRGTFSVAPSTSLTRRINSTMITAGTFFTECTRARAHGS